MQNKNLKNFSKLFSMSVGLFLSQQAMASILQVGPQKAYATPCQAVARAVSGDIIEIDAIGSATNYAGDVCYIGVNNLTLRGVNGRPVIKAAGKNSQGKGTWVIGGTNVIVDNVELSGSTVPDGNGAAIRYQTGTKLTIRNSYFHSNQNGILTSSGANTEILIENTEFANNGNSVGPSHNIYIGNIKKFTLKSSYSRDAVYGHLVKSRAQENHILYNRLSHTKGGNTSYELDLPNAGTSYIIGNIIHQPSVTGNSGIMAYGMEGASNAGKRAYIINNTFVNDLGRGTFINLGSGTSAVVQNNIFGGVGTAVGGAGAAASKISNNYAKAQPEWVSRANFDFRPTATAPFINKGVSPGLSPTGVSLKPTLHYVHVAKSAARPVVGALDIGAFEYTSAITKLVQP